jgi:hypothetical protein
MTLLQLSARHPLPLPHTHPPQFLCYGSAIIISGIWLVLWARLRYKSPSEAQTIWRPFVWYMALVILCSIAGMGGSSFFVYSKFELFNFQNQKAGGIATAQQLYMMRIDDDVTFGYFLGLTGSETFLLGFAQIMILHRLMGRVKTTCPRSVRVNGDKGGETQAGISSQSLLNLKRFFRVVTVLLVICSVNGFVNAILAVLGFGKLGKLLFQAAEACDELGRDTNASKAISARHSAMITEVNSLTSYVVLSKAVLLFVVIFAFIFIGFYCISILRSARQEIAKSIRSLDVLQNSLPQHSAHSAGSASDDTPRFSSSPASDAIDLARSMLESPQQEALKQERRLIVVFHVCLWTILPRLAHDIMYQPPLLISTLLLLYSNADSICRYLVGNLDSAISLSCGSCGPCQSFYWLVSEWLWQTPEFLLAAFAISSPLPLAISPLLIMSDREKLLLRFGALRKKADSAQRAANHVEIGAKKIRDHFKITF